MRIKRPIRLSKGERQKAENLARTMLKYKYDIKSEKLKRKALMDAERSFR